MQAELVGYFPAGHKHAEDPSFEYDPGGQDDPHVAADVAHAASENFPAAHGEHTDEDAAPNIDENVQAGQDVHVAPDGSANFPALQGIHEVRVESAMVPESHATQVVGEVAPNAVEYVLPVQRLHADADVDAIYLPGSQAEQVATVDAPVREENLPKLHPWHVFASLAPTAVEYLPRSHSTQSLLVELPGVGKYLPAIQALQALDPEYREYLPLSQERQFASALLPMVGRYFPALHDWQLVVPLVVE